MESNFLSTIGRFSVNSTLLKDIKVNNEYSSLEFYYIEDEEPCLIIHFDKLEDAYTTLNLFKETMIKAQLKEYEDDNI